VPARIHKLEYSTTAPVCQSDPIEKQWEDVQAWIAAGKPARLIDTDGDNLFENDLSREPVEDLSLLDDPHEEQEAICSADLVGPPDEGIKKAMKTGSGSPSKKVTKRFRRSIRNDQEVIRKIIKFEVTPDMACNPALVAILNPSHSPSIVRAPLSVRPSNDNLIPVWEKSSDWVKLVMANEALGWSRRPPASFTLDLAPHCITEALRDPKGFTDSMKRCLSRSLYKQLGYDTLYWFCVDISKAGHLHLHGGIIAHPLELERIDAALRHAGGHKPKTSAENDHMVHFNPQQCDWGWVQYAFRNRGAVRKAIIGRTFSITGPLRAEAKELYHGCRAVMNAV
jgi:hypothetical protein